MMRRMASTGTKLDLTTLRVGAILNTASGQCSPEAEQEVDALLVSAIRVLDVFQWVVRRSALGGDAGVRQHQHSGCLLT